MWSIVEVWFKLTKNDNGVLFINYFRNEKKKNANSEYYIGLFEDLKAEVVKKGHKKVKNTKTMDCMTSC